MAYITEKVGAYAELIAEASLIATGFENVSRPITREYYDLSATDPLSKEHLTFQVKTLKRREDRGGNLVLFAKRGNGKPYKKDEAADFYIGVLVDDGEVPKVYAMKNRDISEYWCKEGDTSEKWLEMSLALDRTELRDVSEDE